MEVRLLQANHRELANRASRLEFKEFSKLVSTLINRRLESIRCESLDTHPPGPVGATLIRLWVPPLNWFLIDDLYGLLVTTTAHCRDILLERYSS